MMIRNLKSKLQHFEKVSERATKNLGKDWCEVGKLLGTGMRGEITQEPYKWRQAL